MEPDMYDRLKSKLVGIANANLEAMDGTTDPIKRIFDENEIVVAVWQDANEADGVGFLLLKGGKLLHEVMASGKVGPARTSAVPCTCYEQAFATKQVFGEPDHHG
jgi:hypothetical protein